MPEQDLKNDPKTGPFVTALICERILEERDGVKTAVRIIRKSSFSAEYKVFCRLLQEARARASLTQQEVAKRLNRPQSYVSKYESGERRLDVIEFLRVVKVLSVKPHDLLKKLE